MSTEEECKGYACPPSQTTDLPECEHGWELGNNTAVCATQQPTSVPLAATGLDGGAVVGFGLTAVLLLALGGIMASRLRRTRGGQDVPRDELSDHA